jgi:hypothetical protein
MLLAAIMSAVAWRIAADERRRSAARVAALAAEIHEPTRAAVAPPTVEDLEMRPTRGDAGTGDLFTAPPPRWGSRWAAVAAGGLLVFGSAVALAIVLNGGGRVGARGTTARRTAAQPAPDSHAAAPRDAVASHPLELVALGHEREGDRLIVRGVVRNPGDAPAPSDLAAVVFIFNREGGFLASGRVTIDRSALRPGGESTFVVTIPGAADAGRYRVSFRTEDRVVPHVDRRGPLQAQL